MTDRIVHFHVGRSVHPVYAEQLHALPDGFRYRYVHPGLGDTHTPTKRIVEQRDTLREARTRAKELAARTLARGGYVRLSSPRISGDVDLIHSAQFLLRNPPKPYVVDFEQVGVFSLYQQLALTRPWARERLRRAILDDRCKHLLPWSNAARDGLLNVVGDSVAHKVTTLRPAIRPVVSTPKTRGEGPLRVLFVGTAFYEKGGVEAIRAATRAENVQLDVISYVPDDFDVPEGVTVHVPARRDLVQRLYAQCHVLLFPSHMDTFGWVVIEAMGHGLPVIAPGHLALNELIGDDSGLLFPAENMLYGDDGLANYPFTMPMPPDLIAALRHPSEAHVDGIAETLTRLAHDDALYERLAAGALARVTDSMEHRRSELTRIYGAAIS
ncbi:glycosyltransferase family 4 protein [Solirubrobacter taibaiensis]|nr:glycosyltransferase family 4 protein [Solirubrobacter taibaiensis]